jgi:DnaJ-domain-containing protein 1
LVLGVGILLAVVVLGLRFRNVMTRLRQADAATLRPPVGSGVEMAEEHGGVDEAVVFAKTSSGREPRRARAKLPTRAARDRPPRRPRHGVRSHWRLEEEGDDFVEPPARASLPSRHRASPIGASGADPRRRAPTHTRTLPAQEDEEAGEARVSPEADLAQSQLAPAPPTHYEVLGIDRGASDADVKRAFFRLSRLYHPDKNVGKEGEADDKFILVRQAYETLSNAALRQDYDFELGCA